MFVLIKWIDALAIDSDVDRLGRKGVGKGWAFVTFETRHHVVMPSRQLGI